MPARRREVPLAAVARYFRVPTPDLPVDYPGRELLLDGGVCNVSKRGVFVRTGAPLRTGTELELAFILPDRAGTIRASSVVRWAVWPDEAAPGDPVGMGLELVGLGRRDRKALEDFVRRFLERVRSNLVPPS